MKQGTQGSAGTTTGEAAAGAEAAAGTARSRYRVPAQPDAGEADRRRDAGGA
ncbi:GntR family transcriptional regulator, partial [Actinospica acidiphila]|nr:GntR family transcriptional regulator [Actinospica acidiphila]